MTIPTPIVDTNDESRNQLQQLADIASQLLERCRALGADQAKVDCQQTRGLNVNVRMGEIETVEATRDREIGVTVYFDGRKGRASTGDVSANSLQATVDQACAIARYTEKDPAAGLAEPELMAQPRNGQFPDFDLWHPWPLDPQRAIELALACESTGREEPLVENSDGASFTSDAALRIHANSHGFLGSERSTQHSLGCALIVGRGDAMQRDGWHTTAISIDALETPLAVGRHAARRAAERLNPRSLPTGEVPVLFATDVARSLIGHLLAAISGGALYREASFLLDSAGTQLFPDWFAIDELPWLQRGFHSTAFDAEGVATRDSSLVCEGVLQRYLLGSYSARRLGLVTTANAGGVHNLRVTANAGGLDEMLQGMGRGLLVTELMGQGVNQVTGDYSRGAAGFWVEQGAIAYPVDGITVAGNLRQMYAAIEAVGSDVDPRSHIATGSILVGSMTVAGNG